MKRFIHTLAAAGVAALSGSASAIELYVNHASTYNPALMDAGTTWPKAYEKPPPALSYARTYGGVTVINVAKGTYTPGTTSAYSFDMVSGVTLLGGYDTATGVRDPALNVTTLSGDIGATDCTNVVKCNVAGSATLNGFTISGGYSSAVGSKGAGVYVQAGLMYLTGCVVENNFCYDGAGVYVSTGGTAYIQGSTVRNNTAAHAGGGVYIYYSGNPMNLITQSTIESNVAGGDGAGVYGYYVPDLRIYSSVFRANAAGSDGGGMYLTHTVSITSNCTIAYNTAADMGGGVWAEGGSWDTMTDIELSILWGNTAGEYPQVCGGDTRVVKCDLQNTVPNYIETVSLWNISSDPLFTSATDLRLRSSSPCVDAGFNSWVDWSWDRDGRTRIMRSTLFGPLTVDLGAYERSLPTPMPAPGP